MISIITKIKKYAWANYFVIFLRYLIGYAFIPSGAIKLMGKKFTSLPVSHPVGHFFDAIYHTGIYWFFLGFCQLLSALLLMSQRYATVGALLFLGIIFNIFLITVGVNFGNTRYITGLLLLASIFLILWDWQRVSALFLISKKIVIEPSSAPIDVFKWEVLGLLLFLFLAGCSIVMLYLKGYVIYGIPILASILAVIFTAFIRVKSKK